MRPMSGAAIVVSATEDNDSSDGLGRAEERLPVGEGCVAVDEQKRDLPGKTFALITGVRWRRQGEREAELLREICCTFQFFR